MSQRQHICVCLCTYNRPEMLGGLLSQLEAQETEGFFNYSIIIVDNDKYESARETVTSFAQKSSVSIEYHVEPEQNIALARNKAVENAMGDFIAFIDDDELPNENWLINLQKAVDTFESDGVLGPVLPRFEKKPPQWVLKGHFFDRPTHRSGHVLSWENTRTGNVLMKRELFIQDSMWFDPALGSGGEDRDFFRRQIEKGRIFVWSNEAPVFETVPPYRWKRTVLLKRALLRGKMALNFPKSRIESVLKSTIAVIMYTCCLPVFFLMGHHVFMKNLIKICDHLGKIFAFLGMYCVKEKYVSS